MFEVGTYVMYGKTGVCRVEAIGPIAMSESDREYYTLVPEYHQQSKICIPVDSDKVVIRPLITKKEAKQLIGALGDLQELKIPNEKVREEMYKEQIKGCDCREIFRLIKTIHKRSQKRLASGSKVTASDERYLHLAKDRLYGELAISLNIAKDKVEEYIEKAQKK